MGARSGARAPPCSCLLRPGRLIAHAPTDGHVVPVTSTLRGYRSEVTLGPGTGGLDRPSAAQCQHVRAVSTGRIATVTGNVGPVDLRIRETLGLLLDLP